MSPIDESDLPTSFRDGLSELRRTHRHLDVKPVVEERNFVAVRLGTYDVTSTRFEEDLAGRDMAYVHDEYVMYARLPRPFPDGGAKGFGTSPPLKRVNHSVQNNPEWTPEIQQSLVDQVDGNVEMYSWGWNGVPCSEPEHMKFAHDLAKRMLEHG